MQHGQDPLGREEPVGDHADEERRDHRRQRRRPVGEPDLGAVEPERRAQPGPHRHGPRAPDEVLQEHHDRQLHANHVRASRCLSVPLRACPLPLCTSASNTIPPERLSRSPVVAVESPHDHEPPPRRRRRRHRLGRDGAPAGLHAQPARARDHALRSRRGAGAQQAGRGRHRRRPARASRGATRTCWRRTTSTSCRLRRPTTCTRSRRCRPPAPASTSCSRSRPASTSPSSAASATRCGGPASGQSCRSSSTTTRTCGSCAGCARPVAWGASIFARVQYLSRVTDWYSGWSWVRTRGAAAATCSPPAATPWTRCGGARASRPPRSPRITPAHARVPVADDDCRQCPAAGSPAARATEGVIGHVTSSTDFQMPYTFGVELMGDRATIRDDLLLWNDAPIDRAALQAACPFPDVTLHDHRTATGAPAIRVETEMPGSPTSRTIRSRGRSTNWSRASSRAARRTSTSSTRSGRWRSASRRTGRRPEVAAP